MKGMNEYFERDRLWICLDIHIVFCILDLSTMKLLLLKLAMTLRWFTVTVHWIPLWQKRAVRVHLIDSLIAWSFQGGAFDLFDSLRLREWTKLTMWKPEDARVDKMDSVTAWGCQGGQNGLCDSLGWQGGDFASSARFLILNKIMPPGASLSSWKA